MEADEYDVIFAALKHPVRRRILLLLDEIGEASFTEIQKTVDVEDTGLMSYHLKELTPLVTQSARGKYRLSEIGETSVALLNKVEKARDISGMVRRELGKLIAEVIYLLGIVVITLSVALSVDIYASIQFIYANGFTIIEMIGLYVFSLLTMYLGVALFTLYDRAYFSKVIRKNVLHSTLFTVAIASILSYSTYTQYLFHIKTMAIVSQEALRETPFSVIWWMMFTRVILFVFGSPFIAYFTCKLTKRRSELKSLTLRR